MAVYLSWIHQEALKGNDFLFIHMDITISASVYKNLL